MIEKYPLASIHNPSLKIILEIMLRFLFLLILYCSIHTSFGQSLSEINRTDSLDVSTFFPNFIKAIKDKDFDFIKKRATLKIACDYCDNRYYSIDELLKDPLKDFANSKIFSAYTKRGYSTLREPYQIEENALYCVWIALWLPEELGKGHEGGSIGFQFIKVNNEFKFYGLTSVP
jgi:hypothetical protein